MKSTLIVLVFLVVVATSVAAGLAIAGELSEPARQLGIERLDAFTRIFTDFKATGGEPPDYLFVIGAWAMVITTVVIAIAALLSWWGAIDGPIPGYSNRLWRQVRGKPARSVDGDPTDLLLAEYLKMTKRD